MTNILHLAVLLSFTCVVNIFMCEGAGRKQDLTFIPTINKTRCGGQTICNDVANYPTKLIEQLLKQKNLTQNGLIFNTEDDQLPVSSRFNIVHEGNTLCGTKKEILKPQAGWNDADNKWFFLVNHGPYEQAIEVEVCENESKPCMMTENLPIRTECRQKYIYRKMLAFDGKMEMKEVKLPSCCSCYFYNNKK